MVDPIHPTEAPQPGELEAEIVEVLAAILAGKTKEPGDIKRLAAAHAAILALITRDHEKLRAEAHKQGWREGQLDCKEHGDPTNHAQFKEAVSGTVKYDPSEQFPTLVDRPVEYHQGASAAVLGSGETSNE